MKDGFIKVAAATPQIEVADCIHNTQEIIKKAKEMSAAGARILVFPELCITGYTCHDLFFNETLLQSAKQQLLVLAEELKGTEGLIFVGLPLEYSGKLYNTAAAINRGEILGIIPKHSIPNYGEFYEARYFTSGRDIEGEIKLGDKMVSFGSKVLFECEEMPQLCVAAEICEDLWTPNPPVTAHAMHGATVLVNCSASNETIGKASYRRELVKGESARLVSAYIYSSAGEGESTQDIVFSGHNLIAENGTLLSEAEKFANQNVYADIDLERIAFERRRMSTFTVDTDCSGYTVTEFETVVEDLDLIRYFDKAPFVPSDIAERNSRCEEILDIQTYGLKKRLEHTKCKSAVIGISGGLDSTLALLVTVRAFDLLGLDRSGITCVTMPCFGTTDRTYGNAVTLTKRLSCTLREINIKAAVHQHFADIGHDESLHNVTYENGQARERTQILMDIANQTNGMVIGTGDMSELALGWATYNGDHMSMYGVNVSIPKTLVRHLVRYYADNCKDKELSDTLLDILDTPVSPELLPPQEDGTIAQKTEDLVGPYELHDFYLYHMLRLSYAPAKVYRLAKQAFAGTYDDATLEKDEAIASQNHCRTVQRWAVSPFRREVICVCQVMRRCSYGSSS